MGWAQMANTAASALVAVTAAVCAAVYHLRAPWWESAAGRHIMAFTGAVGLLSLYTVLLTVWWPHGPVAAGLRVTRVVVLVALAALLVQRTRMVIRAQRDPDPPDA